MKNRSTIVFWLIIILTTIVTSFLIRRIKLIDDKMIEDFIESTTTEHTTISTTSTTTKTTHKITIKTTTKEKTSTKQEYMNYAKEYGNLNDTQLQCLDYLWTHESNWNPNDVNKSSGACGIPQAYPCKKIVQSEGSNDWKAQIRWGIKYINNRYKNPCSAWNHFKNRRWY